MWSFTKKKRFFSSKTAEFIGFNAFFIITKSIKLITHLCFQFDWFCHVSIIPANDLDIFPWIADAWNRNKADWTRLHAFLRIVAMATEVRSRQILRDSPAKERKDALCRLRRAAKRKFSRHRFLADLWNIIGNRF